MTDTQAIAARLTAIAAFKESLIEGRQRDMDGLTVPLDTVEDILAHVETLEREKAELEQQKKQHWMSQQEIQDWARQLAGDSVLAGEIETTGLSALQQCDKDRQQAEQARDTAHAALERINALPSELAGDAWAIARAALAASAPQKTDSEGDAVRQMRRDGNLPPAPAQ